MLNNVLSKHDTNKDNHVLERRREIKAEIKKEFSKESMGPALFDLFGLFTFFFIAIIFIPQTLIFFDLYYVLPIYLPNVDMLATVLTFIRGPGDIWKNLYLSDPDFIVHFYTQTMINYAALIGMCYIISTRAYSEGIYVGWSYAIIMIMCSYLLPGYIIKTVMDYSFLYTNSIYVSVFASMGIIIPILLFESLLIFDFKYQISSIVKYIMQHPNLGKLMR